MKRLLPLLFLALAALAQNATVGTFSSTTANITTATIGAGGGQTYTELYSGVGKDDDSYTAGATTTAWEPELNGYGSPITNTFSGTCTNIAIKASCLELSGTTFKIGLYNSSSNLVANGTANAPDTNVVWLNVSVSATVSNDTYRVMAFADNSNGAYQYDTDAGNYGVSDPTDYASAPPDPLVPDHFDNYIFAVKMGILH